jgi:methyl-accepting chemotaxis protein
MNTMRLLRLTTLGPIFGLVVLAVLAFFNQRETNRAQINRYESYRLAQELRASSEDLTRLARTYVVTGDPSYEQQYWRVLDVRNGIAPRPDGRTVPLRALMKAQGFSTAEFAKLGEAEDNSNALVTTETIAMNAIKGQFDDGQGGYTRRGPPDPEMARRIMHDQKYHADKAVIMQPIAEFERLLDQRTEALAAAGRRRGDVAMVLGMLLATAAAASTWMSLRRHGTTLQEAIGELACTSEYVAVGATQIASSSRYLADGADQQVSALEDIAGSAREMGDMATSSARSTQAMSDVVSREQRHFQETMDQLADMLLAMEEIDAASDRISRINKVIDEIAFQTNILALNAAVEAARAGEAGLGFAVVADEVRNLAQRSAQAARETAALIEESITRTRAGRGKVDQVTNAIRSLAAQSAEVQSLVEDVRLGSRDQHQAIERVRAAIERIEQVSKQAAAGATQGSAAAEQLTAQAGGLRDVVATLEKMVEVPRRPAATR